LFNLEHPDHLSVVTEVEEDGDGYDDEGQELTHAAPPKATRYRLVLRMSSRTTAEPLSWAECF
jgi:hypothetical protein